MKKKPGMNVIVLITYEVITNGSKRSSRFWLFTNHFESSTELHI